MSNYANYGQIKAVMQKMVANMQTVLFCDTEREIVFILVHFSSYLLFDITGQALIALLVLSECPLLPVLEHLSVEEITLLILSLASK